MPDVIGADGLVVGWVGSLVQRAESLHGLDGAAEVAPLRVHPDEALEDLALGRGRAHADGELRKADSRATSAVARTGSRRGETAEPRKQRRAEESRGGRMERCAAGERAEGGAALTLMADS